MLFDQGKAKGFLTYDEVNDHMPPHLSGGDIDEVVSLLIDEHIEIVESSADFERGLRPAAHYGTHSDIDGFTVDQLRYAGRKAISAGDFVVAGKCIDVLNERGTKAARVVRDDLCRQLELIDTAPAPTPTRRPSVRTKSRVPGPSRGTKPATGPVFDGDIAPRRLQLLRLGNSTILMTSLTFPSDDIVKVLQEKARSGVRVVLVVAEWAVRGKRRSAIQGIERSGGLYIEAKATHSKITVVDQEWVMMGSANAHGGHRDANHVFQDRGLANEYGTYVETLVKEGSRRSPKRTKRRR